MNVSVPDFNKSNLDYVKLALFMGDEYVLNQFGRASNQYCRSALDEIKRNANQPHRVSQALEQMRTELNSYASKLIKSENSGKFVSINVHNGRVEFRGPGGDYLSKSPEEITSTAFRVSRALKIACDPEAYKKEYAKKLYKLLQPSALTQTVDPTTGTKRVNVKQGNEDVIGLFSKYAAGELPMGALKSFIKNAQRTRNAASVETEYNVWNPSTAIWQSIKSKDVGTAMQKAMSLGFPYYGSKVVDPKTGNTYSAKDLGVQPPQMKTFKITNNALTGASTTWRGYSKEEAYEWLKNIVAQHPDNPHMNLKNFSIDEVQQ
jgi:hypothetical protein